MAAPQASEQVRWETVVWQPVVHGRRRTVPISVLVSPEAAANVDRQVHSYQGLGEGRRAARADMALMRAHGLGGVVVHLAYHHLAPEHIEQTLVEAPIAVADQIAQGHAIGVHGRSAGGGPALMAAGEAPERFASVGLLSPAGILNEHFGATPGTRRATFLQRLAVTNALATIRQGLDWGDCKQLAGIVLELGHHARRRQLVGAIDHALHPGFTARGLAGLATLHGHQIPVRILAPTEDQVFPNADFRRVLDMAGLEHIVADIVGLHTNVRSRSGAAQYAQLAAWTRSLQASMPPPT